ncbi:hypothetical protein [Wukongibacter baidiensis]
MSKTIAKSNGLINGIYSILLTTSAQKLLITMLCSSSNNTLLNHISKDNSKIIYGFLSAKSYSALLEIKNCKNTYTMMSRFAKSYRNLQVIIEKKSIIVFSDLRYSSGELAWQFTEEFGKHFYNEKIFEVM